jgi:hypothetical protein
MFYPHLFKKRLALAVLLMGLAAASPHNTSAQQPQPNWPAEDHFVYIPFVAKPVDANAAPVIASFIATPATITPTGSSTLSWRVSGAISLSINGIGVVAGSTTVVKPITTTQYTLTARNAKGTATATTTVTVKPADSPTRNTFFLQYLWSEQIWQSVQPQVAIDSAGGVHVAYGSRRSGAVFYGYCAANCTSLDHFQSVALGGGELGATHLALDSAEHPRLLIEEYADGKPNYRYAECNAIGASCASLANWNITGQLGAGEYSSSDVESSHPFALDGRGHPRFVYSRRSVNGTDATYLMACDSDCTSDANWTQTTLSEAWWDNLNLAFTPQGLPRLAYVAKGNNTQGNSVDRIFYLECNTANCSAMTGPLVVQDFQGAGVFAMRLDSAGRPRMAINPGWGRVFYFVCDANCATDDQQWTYLDIGLPDKASTGSALEQGQLGIDLALDKNDRPRIAFHISQVIGELGYTWCNIACRDAQQGWHSDIIASKVAADQELGHIRLRCDNCIPKLPDCQSVWDAGYWPALALDASGNPRIVYESQLWTFAPGGACSTQAIARVSRIAVFDQP